jgi:hypothetical protein
MQTQHEQLKVLEETYERYLTPPATDRSARISGVLGLLLLVLMLLIATGTVPLYTWDA